MRRAGFALIEVAIVIAVLVVIAMLAIQGFSFYNRLFLHNELDKLYLMFIAHSRRAAVDNQACTLIFDEQHGRYQSSHVTERLIDGIVFGTIPGAKGPPSNPREIISKSVTFQNRRITFYPDGRVQPGTLYLTDTKRQWLYALSCSVGSISYVRRYRYEQNQWVLLT